ADGRLAKHEEAREGDARGERRGEQAPGEPRIAQKQATEGDQRDDGRRDRQRLGARVDGPEQPGAYVDHDRRPERRRNGGAPAGRPTRRGGGQRGGGGQGAGGGSSRRAPRVDRPEDTS